MKLTTFFMLKIQTGNEFKAMQIGVLTTLVLVKLNGLGSTKLELGSYWAYVLIAASKTSWRF